MKVGTDGTLLGAWADVSQAKTILDIGTGSGLIALMLAQRTKVAKIEGVEIDPASCQQAQDNMAASPWSDRLVAIQSPIQEFASTREAAYELIVSNPPFFTGGNLSYNQDRNSVRHTIKLSHQDLLSAVRKLLRPDGRFCLILPYIEGLRFCELAASYQLYCQSMTEVRSKKGKPIKRLLLQFGKEKIDTQLDELIIHQSEVKAWTPAYKKLTRAFYLKL